MNGKYSSFVTTNMAAEPAKRHRCVITEPTATKTPDGTPYMTNRVVADGYGSTKLQAIHRAFTAYRTPPVIDSLIGVHPDLRGMFNSKGGLFDVDSPDMEANIGRPAVFTEPKCDYERRQDFRVTAIQKNYRGELCYRVVSDSEVHKFGTCVSPDRITFTD